MTAPSGGDFEQRLIADFVIRQFGDDSRAGDDQHVLPLASRVQSWFCRARPPGPSLAPLPNNGAIPVKLRHGAVAEDAFAVVLVILILNEDVAVSPAVDRRIDQIAQLSRVVPAMNLLAFWIDQVRLEVERAEAHQAPIGLRRVVVDQSGSAGAAAHQSSLGIGAKRVRGGEVDGQ